MSSKNELEGKIRDGLNHCMPVTKQDAQLTCESCPYHPSCDGTEYALSSARLPASMVEDIRRLVSGEMA